eukprot:5407549-Alexandrium_andersonii.AAC.1
MCTWMRTCVHTPAHSLHLVSIGGALFFTSTALVYGPSARPCHSAAGANKRKPSGLELARGGP